MLSSIEKFIGLLVNSTVNFTLNPISHESRSDDYDIGFSSEIYFGIHQFGNEFFLNRLSFKRRQAHPRRANEKRKEPFKSQLSIASEYIKITLKLEAIKKKKTFLVQGERRVLLKYFIPLYL